MSAQKSISGSHILFWIIVGAGIALLVVLGLAVMYLKAIPANELGYGDLGAMGDFVGGLLNPVVAIISICLFAYTLRQNAAALRISTSELIETRKQLKLSADAHSDMYALQFQQESGKYLCQKFEHQKARIDIGMDKRIIGASPVTFREAIEVRGEGITITYPEDKNGLSYLGFIIGGSSSHFIRDFEACINTMEEASRLDRVSPLPVEGVLALKHYGLCLAISYSRITIKFAGEDELVRLADVLVDDYEALHNLNSRLAGVVASMGLSQGNAHFSRKLVLK